MELDEIDAILEKVWDLHDKLSDAIHSVSRSHFLKTLAPNSNRKSAALNDDVVHGNDNGGAGTGFVYVKDFKVCDDSAVREAKSLNAIRTALESLEDQLDFFQTVQTQQRAERDAAIARLEQSRIVLAMRLADHQGKKYKVIEEALAFVGDVNNSGRFASNENLSGFVKRSSQDGKRTNLFIKAVTSTIGFAKNSLKLDQVGGILGNAALVAISMLAMLHVNHLVYKDSYNSEPRQEQGTQTRSSNTTSTSLGRSSTSHLSQLDVLLARG